MYVPTFQLLTLNDLDHPSAMLMIIIIIIIIIHI